VDLVTFVALGLVAVFVTWVGLGGWLNARKYSTKVKPTTQETKIPTKTKPTTQEAEVSTKTRPTTRLAEVSTKAKPTPQQTVQPAISQQRRSWSSWLPDADHAGPWLILLFGGPWVVLILGGIISPYIWFLLLLWIPPAVVVTVATIINWIAAITGEKKT
jgi:hypothetical protein